jgi:hypothetical protein
MMMLNFYLILAPIALGLFGMMALLGLVHKHRQPHLALAEKAELGFSLQLSFFTVVFAILPFVVFGEAMWRWLSLALALFLGLQMARAFYLHREFEAEYPAVLGLLLALSGIFLTIEVFNTLFWNASFPYGSGLLWLFILTGIQFIAFVCYDSLPSPVSVDHHPVDAVQHGLRGHSRPSDPHGAPNPYPYAASGNGQSPLGRDPNRYSDPRHPVPHRRAVRDTAVRTEQPYGGGTTHPHPRP